MKINYLSVVLIILLINSCENNPTNTIYKEPNVIFDLSDFDIFVSNPNDSTWTINVNYTLIFHSENSGFQTITDGFMLWDSDRMTGRGLGAYFNFDRKLDYRFYPMISPDFIEPGELDTIQMEYKYTTYSKNSIKIFEYQLYGFYTNEAFYSNPDSIGINSFYYQFIDTLEYD